MSSQPAIVNPVGRHQRQRDVAFSLRVTQINRAARHGRGDGRIALHAANPGVDNGRARRFNGLRQFYRFGESAAAFNRSSMDNQ
ncbi:hypothetical protein ACNKHX_18955 [Shigella flexneri]